MTKALKRRGVKPPEKVWKGLMTFDGRGPDFFFDERYFPNIRKDWSYGESPEFLNVEIRLVPTKKRRKR